MFSVPIYNELMQRLDQIKQEFDRELKMVRQDNDFYHALIRLKVKLQTATGYSTLLLTTASQHVMLHELAQSIKQYLTLYQYLLLIYKTYRKQTYSTLLKQPKKNDATQPEQVTQNDLLPKIMDTWQDVFSLFSFELLDSFGLLIKLVQRGGDSAAMAKLKQKLEDVIKNNPFGIRDKYGSQLGESIGRHFEITLQNMLAKLDDRQVVEDVNPAVAIEQPKTKSQIVSQDVECPVTQQLYAVPVRIDCGQGHVLERATADEILKQSKLAKSVPSYSSGPKDLKNHDPDSKQASSSQADSSEAESLCPLCREPFTSYSLATERAFMVLDFLAQESVKKDKQSVEDEQQDDKAEQRFSDYVFIPKITAPEMIEQEEPPSDIELIFDRLAILALVHFDGPDDFTEILTLLAELHNAILAEYPYAYTDGFTSIIASFEQKFPNLEINNDLIASLNKLQQFFNEWDTLIGEAVLPVDRLKAPCVFLLTLYQQQHLKHQHDQDINFSADDYVNIFVGIQAAVAIFSKGDEVLKCKAENVLNPYLTKFKASKFAPVAGPSNGYMQESNADTGAESSSNGIIQSVAAKEYEFNLFICGSKNVKPEQIISDFYLAQLSNPMAKTERTIELLPWQFEADLAYLTVDYHLHGQPIKLTLSVNRDSTMPKKAPGDKNFDAIIEVGDINPKYPVAGIFQINKDEALTSEVSLLNYIGLLLVSDFNTDLTDFIHLMTELDDDSATPRPLRGLDHFELTAKLTTDVVISIVNNTLTHALAIKSFREAIASYQQSTHDLSAMNQLKTAILQTRELYQHALIDLRHESRPRCLMQKIQLYLVGYSQVATVYKQLIKPTSNITQCLQDISEALKEDVVNAFSALYLPCQQVAKDLDEKTELQLKVLQQQIKQVLASELFQYKLTPGFSLTQARQRIFTRVQAYTGKGKQPETPISASQRLQLLHDDVQATLSTMKKIGKQVQN